MKEGHFLCPRHGGRADVGLKEQLKLDMRQAHVGKDTQPRTVDMKGVENPCLSTVQDEASFVRVP